MAKLYLTIGIPGSGKSYWSNNIIESDENTVVISSDSIRGDLFGDESIQYTKEFVKSELEKSGKYFPNNLTNKELEAFCRKVSNNAVFKILDNNVLNALSIGNNVVYDATSITKYIRKSIIEKFKYTGCEFIAVYFDIDLKTAIYRNEKRSRTVPVNIIESMYNRIEPPSFDEGFDYIITVK